MENSIHTFISICQNRACKAVGLVLVIAMILASTTGTAYADIKLTTSDEIGIMTDSTKVFDVVDEMPKIKGGMSKIYEHVKYPRLASRSGIEGKVFIKFVVNEQGKVEDPKILKDIGGGCGEAAVEGIKKVEFEPGKHNG
ncbi:MAG TPA: hypothetical protein DD671_05430, partial [Balneolaceae bacterium]|nr:hypothetical protein [Balneolaceae bacterium]